MINSNINKEVGISIIIPCYNASAYLGRLSNCIDQQLKSCLGENNQIVEFVLVNDGSKDDTLQQLLRIKEKYPLYITVVDQPNMGVSAARNAGVDKSKGKYIGFLDSDDVLKEGAIPFLLQKILKDDFDVLIYDYKSIQDFSEIESLKSNNSAEVIYDGMLRDYFLNFDPIVVWRMLYKSNLIKDNNIKFPPITIGEDTLFNFCVFMLEGRVKHIDSVLCYHIDRENSLTTSVNAAYVRKIVSSVVTIQESYNNYISEKELTPEIVSKIGSHRKRQVYFVFSKLIASTNRFPTSEINKIRKELEESEAFPIVAVSWRERLINIAFRRPWLLHCLYYLQRIRRIICG